MDGKHYGYYKKKTYTTSRSIQQVISKKNFNRDIKITERVPYSIYYQACDFHNRHRDISELYVLQVSTLWIEVKLIIH